VEERPCAELDDLIVAVMLHEQRKLSLIRHF
jgi:hypothetical protein